VSRARSNRRRLQGALVTFASCVALASLTAPSGHGEPLAPGVGPLPQLGTVDPAATLIGAAPAGELGEAWAYRQLPLAVGGAEAGSRPIPFGPPLEAGNPRPQLAFFRHTDASGWQLFETPVDLAGNPYRGPVPIRAGRGGC
jgi:hypothetical protein